MEKGLFKTAMPSDNRTHTQRRGETPLRFVMGFLLFRGRLVLFQWIALLSSIISVPLARADVVPYFQRSPKDTAMVAVQDFFLGLSPMELFVIAACLIVAMETVFLVGLIRTRRKHVDK